MWGVNGGGCAGLSAVRESGGRRADSSGGGGVDGSGRSESADGALDFGGMGDGDGGLGEFRAGGADFRAGEFSGVGGDAGSFTDGSAFVLHEEAVPETG